MRERLPFRRATLALAKAFVMSCMAAGPVLAQSASGSVTGRAAPGQRVVLTQLSTGFTRTVTSNGQGSYLATQLPVGEYEVRSENADASAQALRVIVSVGATATVNLRGENTTATETRTGGEVGQVTVRGSRVINRVDVRSTETATNLNRQELARLPVDQSLGAVAMLAPGVITGNSSFGGISFGGSSVAENSVFINGLNVTDFYRRQSFSTAPYAFFQSFQVKTGGYSVEFGRATGGVINAVTRSGGNTPHGGIELTFEPQLWRSHADDHYQASGKADYLASRDTQDFAKANVWASGALLKDRLFAFAMYEKRLSTSRYTTGSTGSTWSKSKSDNGFWGAKIDWRVTPNHLVELLAFSDAAAADGEAYSYSWERDAKLGKSGESTSESGGRSGSLTWTGFFGENFTAKAMIGSNRSRAMALSPADDLCNLVSINSSYSSVYRSMGSPAVSCHPGGTVVRHEDERKVGRLDFDWRLGTHQLRFGLDREVMTTDRTTRYPGTGLSYTVYATTPGTQLNDIGAVVPAGVNAYVAGRRRADGGVFETVANAYYLEDNWNLTPDLLLNLGLRMDSFTNKTATGAPFIRMKNLLSPRLGFAWDVGGKGTMKLFGNAGRYYLPVTNNLNYTFAGGLTDEYSYWVLSGWEQKTNPITGATYQSPVLGAQLGPVDTRMNVTAADLRQSVDRDLKAVYQDELILGFQQVLSAAWSWGVNATWRNMHGALDDIRINHTPCGNTSTMWPIGNPGEPLTIWGTTKMGCATDGWITIDTATDGYVKGGSGQVIGYFKPRRTYKSIEFQLDRAWDGKWSFNASYLWSKLTGNHEGPVNSDTNYGDTGMVQSWDHPAVNERYGPLFNDHTHQIKLRGAYAFNSHWSVGASFRAVSGGPITAFGVTWPGDSLAAASYTSTGSGGGSGWLCTANCSGTWSQRQYAYSPRGAFGRLPWLYDVGANLAWTMPLAGGSELRARLSVYNLLNSQKVINVVQRYEGNPGVMREEFGAGTRWQSPRYAQFVLGWSF